MNITETARSVLPFGWNIIDSHTGNIIDVASNRTSAQRLVDHYHKQRRVTHMVPFYCDPWLNH